MDFILGIVGNIIASTIIAVFLVKIFKVPKLSLHVEYVSMDAIRNPHNPALILSVVNEKKWVGFGPGDINFGLFLPSELSPEKNHFGLMTGEGLKDWHHNVRSKETFTINGEVYHHYRGVVHLAVHPDSRIHFLTIKGGFHSNKQVFIYYYFDTPNGRIPSFLKFGERKKVAEAGKLPFTKITF